MVQNKDMLSKPVVTSNLQWHKGINMLQFLRDVGVHARVNTMLNRERYLLFSWFLGNNNTGIDTSVRARLKSQQGLSFTELTYQLLQAYDFYHLHKHFGCTVQVGGSDQWGNILAGLDLIARMKNTPSVKAGTVDSPDIAPDAFGITTPLLTTASGAKFGKSMGNAIWLDPNTTSVLDFYQVSKVLSVFALYWRSKYSTSSK
jgi:tyrosyl-tRNA synthetase